MRSRHRVLIAGMFLLIAAIVVGLSCTPRQGARLACWAIRHRCYPIARVALLRADFDGDGVSQTPLHCAAAYGDKRVVSFLLRHSVEVDARDCRWATPLSLAAAAGHLEVVELLVRAGANVTTQSFYGTTPAYRAAAMKQYQTARWLIEKGQPVDLLTASALGDAEAVTATVEGGEDPNRADAFGATPVYWAVLRNNERMLSILLRHGARADTMSPIGTPVLHIAAQHGNKTLVEILLRHGANPDAKSRMWGDTALHRALQESHDGVAELLIRSGADGAAKDYLGHTPAQRRERHMKVPVDDPRREL